MLKITDKQPKKYILFKCPQYYPLGGFLDEHYGIDTIDDAIDIMNRIPDGFDDNIFFHLVDLSTLLVIKEWSKSYDYEKESWVLDEKDD